jgi:hypothetical protein
MISMGVSFLRFDTHTHPHTQDKTLDDNVNDDNDDADRQKKKKKKRTQRTIKAIFFLLGDIAHTQTQTHKRESDTQM